MGYSSVIGKRRALTYKYKAYYKQAGVRQEWLCSPLPHL